MSAYILLICILLANLAWLMNPHACCPRLDEVCRCEQMACPMNTESVCSEDMSETSCFDDVLSPGSLKFTLSDQFSKGLTNDVPDNTPASILRWSESHQPIFSPEPANQEHGKYASIVIPPVEKPPAI